MDLMRVDFVKINLHVAVDMIRKCFFYLSEGFADLFVA
jgi:hypothetical protein